MELGPQTIISLQVENFLRIHAVRIEPKGNTVVISGNNGEGKTSLLNAIWVAMGGKDAVPDMPVHQGQEAADVRLELTDLIVTKNIKPDRTCTLKVTGKDGGKYNAPQSILDALVGALSFDPMAFARMERSKQLVTLKQLVGLDFSADDRRRQTIYDQRTACTQIGNRLKGQLAGMPFHATAPADAINLAEIMQEHARALEINHANGEKRRDVGRLEEQARVCEDEVHRLEQELKLAQERLTVACKQAEMARALAKACVDVDVSGIEQKIRTAEETNRQVEANKYRAKVDTEYQARQSEWKQLTAALEEIDKGKAAKLQAAAFPIQGLSITDTAVVLNGIPFDQLSAAEQQRISLAMGFALNPKLRVLLLRDASLMDDKTLAMVSAMAAEHNAQVWLERVGEGQESAVVIEDGYVKGAPTPAPIATLDKISPPPLKLAPKAEETKNIVAGAAAAFTEAAGEALDKHPDPAPRPRPTFGRPGRRT